MSNVSKAYIPWRDRAYLSLDEAGLVVARSADWIRTRICEGQLEGVRIQKGGPLVVTVASVAALVDRIVDPLPARTPDCFAAFAYPCLAWVNPQPTT